MADYIVNPTNQQIREIGGNIESLFDPRRKMIAQQAQATTNLTNQRTLTETERTREMKGRNDAGERTGAIVDELGHQLGWDANPALHKFLTNALESTRGKNPAQIVDAFRQVAGAAKLFTEDPNAMRQGMAILGHTPTNTTALTTGEQTEHADTAQAGRMALQESRNTQSGANTAATVAGAMDRQKARIAAKTGGASAELAETQRQIVALEKQINAAASDWRVSKMAGVKDKSYGDPNKEKAGMFEAEIQKLRDEHDALVRTADQLRGQAAPSPGAAGLIPTQAAPAPTAPTAAPAAPTAADVIPTTPGQGFSFGANAAQPAPAQPFTPGPNTITVGQPPAQAAQPQGPDPQVALQSALRALQRNPAGKAQIQKRFFEMYGVLPDELR